MLRQSAHNTEASGVATAPRLGNTTSVQPMESTSNIERVETRSEGADLINSAGDEEKEAKPGDISGRNKRRKTTTRSARKQIKADHPMSSSMTTGKRNLSLLPTMPLDILFEIFGHLSPKDILNISRVSKLFRETLMSRSATTVWKAGRDRVGAPACPSWMSEPAWAALLFGHVCQSCGTSNVHKVDFLLFKRVCGSCKKAHLLIRSKAARRYPGILDLVPSTNVSAWFHGHAGNSYYYWDTDIEGMANRLLNLEADVKKDVPNSQKVLLDFREEHRQRVIHIQQVSPQWRAWCRAVQLERDKERREAQIKRIEQIKERFRELGYTDEDLACLGNQKECNSTAPLTKQSWTRIRPALEPHVVVRKAERLEKEAAKIRRNRKHVIHLRYKEYRRTLHPSQWKYLPTTLEVIGYEPFASHVEAPVEAEVTAATFDDAFAHLPELLAASMKEQKESLRALLPNEPADENINTRYDPMDLATAAFRCKSSDCSYLFGWDDIASHHCGEQEALPLSMLYNDDRQSTIISQVEYSPFAASVVRKVAQIARLDCASTTAAHLDRENMRFSCDSCVLHKEEGTYYEAGYNWRRLADHVSAFHNRNLNITVFFGREAEEVRRCERNNKWVARQWACTHCPEHLDNLQTRQTVLEHLHDSHAILMAYEPYDFLCVERCRKVSLHPPKFTVRKTVDPTPLFRCLLCRDDTSDSLYILPNIEDHLKKIHQVIDAEVGRDFEASHRLLEQPIFGVLGVRFDLKT